MKKSILLFTLFYYRRWTNSKKSAPNNTFEYDQSFSHNALLHTGSEEQFCNYRFHLIYLPNDQQVNDNMEGMSNATCEINGVWFNENVLGK